MEGSIKQHLPDWQEPVTIVAPQLALTLLKKAEKARSQLDEAASPKALHMLRVSIKRLRTCLRAYQAALGKDRIKTPRQQLGSLMDATNLSRDQAVHMRWLQRQQEDGTLSRLQQDGLQLMLDHLEEQEHLELDWCDLLPNFDRIAKKLRHRLAKAQQHPRHQAKLGQITFAQRTHDLVVSDLAELRQQLTSISSVQEVATIHQARLLVKRIRYLLEPFHKQVPASMLVLAQLKQLQDQLGELHDLAMLENQIIAVLEEAARSWAHHLIDSTGQVDSQPSETMSALPVQPPEAKPCYALAALFQYVHAQNQRLFRQQQQLWVEETVTSLFLPT